MTTEHLADTTVLDLLGAIASESPTPGGGSVVMLTAAMGISLVAMAINITMRKVPSPPSSAPAVLTRAMEFRAKFVELAERDVEVFGEFMHALRLPKSTEEEKRIRSAQIERAAIAASEVPLSGAEQCAEARRLIASIDWIDPAVRSDVVSGEYLIQASARAVLQNVEPNLRWIKTAQMAEQLRSRYRRVASQIEI